MNWRIAAGTSPTTPRQDAPAIISATAFTEAGKHVIFFRREPAGIVVSRILHERMLRKGMLSMTKNSGFFFRPDSEKRRTTRP
jgi:plasmid stabilization system protein ParE